jgi:hypothetical protein
MNRETLLAQFEALLPSAAAWATEQEERVLHHGVLLFKKEIADASAAGVRQPQRIRLLQIETIPRRLSLRLKPRAMQLTFSRPQRED